jgi:hypothetical protein
MEAGRVVSKGKVREKGGLQALPSSPSHACLTPFYLSTMKVRVALAVHWPFLPFF